MDGHLGGQTFSLVCSLQERRAKSSSLIYHESIKFQVYLGDGFLYSECAVAATPSSDWSNIEPRS